MPGGDAARSRPEWVFAVFFLTGATGLVFQVIWTRLLMLGLGQTVHAMGTVLAAFMGGLALGSVMGGRWADRSVNPFRLYGILEVITGLLALLSSLALQHLPDGVALAHRFLDLPFHGFSPWVLVVALLILLPPTFCMGATLPMLARGVTRQAHDAGPQMGRLYAVNTLGAALGGALTGFVLLAWFGIQATLQGAALINVLVGIAVFAGFRRFRREPEAVTAPVVAVAPPLTTPLPWAFGLSGFAALAAEVCWTRGLAPFLESSIYAFSLVVTVFLMGIALGSLAALRRSQGVTSPVVCYGYSQVMVGYATLAGLALLPVFVAQQSAILPDLGAIARDGGGVLSRGLVWFPLLLLPATFFMGYGFPFVARWAADNFQHLAGRTGLAYGLNTVGAVLGSLLAGFWLLPMLGVKESLLALTLVNFGAGFWLLAVSRAGGLTLTQWAGLLLAGLSLMLAARSLPDVERQALALAYPTWEIQELREDPEASVALLRPRDGGDKRSLTIGLRPVSGSSDYLTAWMTHLPMLFTPTPPGGAVRVLNIGLGYGHTFATALRYPGSEVHGVELVPSVIGIFRRNHPDAEGILANPRGRLVAADGRNYLLAQEQPFDVIIIDPTPPLYGAGAVNLYTRDFFELCRRKLTPKGRMLLRIPRSADLVSSWLLVRTAVEVFPHASLWQRHANSGFSLVLSPTAQPAPTAAELGERLREAAFLPDGEKGYLLEQMPRVLAEHAGLVEGSAGLPVVSDDRPYLEHPLFFQRWREVLSRKREGAP